MREIIHIITAHYAVNNCYIYRKGLAMYLYELPNWPKFEWDNSRLLPLISEVRALQGLLMGKLSSLGFDTSDMATIESMSLEIVKSNAIEGERLNREDVRSSIAKRLGKEWPSINQNRNIDGIVEVMFDAFKNCNEALTHERLYGWHAAMFPTGYSGIQKIHTAGYRNTPGEQMVVESGAMNSPIVHFKAPNDEYVKEEMDTFIHWFNTDKTEYIIKSGIAHLWFLTIHPFEDGNGRIARALSDMILAQSDTSEFRFYSVSDRIETKRKAYYEILEVTQRSDMDVTDWIVWFVTQVKASLEKSEILIDKVVRKAKFWLDQKDTIFHKRQRKIINKLFDGFEGKLNTSRYAKICKCSEDTALRDLKNLVDKDVLAKGAAGGRSSYYYLRTLGDSSQ